MAEAIGDNCTLYQKWYRSAVRSEITDLRKRGGRVQEQVRDWRQHDNGEVKQPRADRQHKLSLPKQVNYCV